MLDNLKKNETLILRMKRVEQIMLEQIQSRHHNVQNTLTDMIHSGGKRLRPVFLLLCSDFGTKQSDEIYEAAAGLELVHMATLIHDDIIDEAKMRRGLITAQSKFGKDYAVFMGDFLLNRSFQLISRSPGSKDFLKIMDSIFYGEMLQYNNRYSRNPSVGRYLRIAGNKTASLFALSFYLGAKNAGCEDALCRTLKKAGYYFGISFQILDDILDFTGNEKMAGKSVQNDIKMGFYTLPVIYSAMADGGRIWELIDANDFDQMSLHIENTQGLERTAQLAKRYLDKAIAQMDKLPNVPAKKYIADILHSVDVSLSVNLTKRVGRTRMEFS